MSFIGIIGTGYWGRNIVRDMNELGKLHAICDLDIKVLNSLIIKFPDIAFSTTNMSDIINNPKITAIIIATPSSTHFEIAQRVLKAGKDCFIEKPMTHSVSEAKELIRLSEENGCILMIGHLLHYHPAIQKIYAMIEANKIGDILYVTSNRLKLGKIRQDENVLWSFAPHDVSLILKLMGEQPVTVTSNGYSTISDCDLSTIILNFSGNRYAQIYVNWLNPFKEYKLTIVGKTGMIVFNGDTIIYHSEYLSDGEIITYDDFKSALQLECEHFINCCENRTTPLTDGNEGLDVITVLEWGSNRDNKRNNNKIDNKKDNRKVNNERDDNKRDNNMVHESSFIDNGVTMGDRNKIWHFSHLMSSAVIGNDCVIGQNCFIAGKIGNGCKVQNNVSIYDGVIAGDNVFFGPSCTFINDLSPRAAYSKNGNYIKTIIEDGATIGANATVLCGITLGSNCMIGAGSVVTKDVLPNTVVVGNPAHEIK